MLTLHESSASVDDKGELATHFHLPGVDMLGARLEVESAIRDERGKFVANRSTAQYRGRDRFVGLRSERWTFEEGKPASIQYLVVDKNGRVIAGVPVSISAAVEMVSAARVKGAGDAYLTSYDSHWDAEGSCSGNSAKGRQNCTFTPSQPGLYSIVARIQDSRGRPHATNVRVGDGQGRGALAGAGGYELEPGAGKRDPRSRRPCTVSG